MLSYELCKQLKEAGFTKESKYKVGIYVCSCSEKQIKEHNHTCESEEDMRSPFLEELIDACGNEFYSLHKTNKWIAESDACGEHTLIVGETPEEAVAYLWLELNKK